MIKVVTKSQWLNLQEPLILRTKWSSFKVTDPKRLWLWGVLNNFTWAISITSLYSSNKGWVPLENLTKCPIIYFQCSSWASSLGNLPPPWPLSPYYSTTQIIYSVVPQTTQHLPSSLPLSPTTLSSPTSSIWPPIFSRIALVFCSNIYSSENLKYPNSIKHSFNKPFLSA